MDSKWTNTVTTDSGAVKITYEDNDNGAYIYFAATGNGSYPSDLTSNLTVGQLYKLTLDAKVNTGSVNIHLHDRGIQGEHTIATVTSTSFTEITAYFKAGDVASCYLQTDGLSSGEAIWFDNFSLKPANGNHGTLV